jgi:hypothetical protein
MFSLQQNQRTRGRTGYAQRGGRAGNAVAGQGVQQTMYMHVRKCKNNKIKKDEKI